MRKIVSVLLLMTLALACEDSGIDPTEGSDNFDREAMLVNWADHIIVPSYQNYVLTLGDLKVSTTAFTADPSLDNLSNLRNDWLTAYLAFQEVSIFEIGPAEAMSFRNFNNVFPTNASEIENLIAAGDYNLELPSTIDAQGFPALDYLLYGTAETDLEIVNVLSTEAHSNYLTDIVNRLEALGNSVLNEWTSTYRDTFVANSGSTATSSVNKMTNDFMFYYEKALRAGKIGIPAGVFSGNPLSDRVEALYSRQFSKQLYLKALESTIRFFKGEHYDGVGQGASFSAYLDYFNENEEEDLAELILSQFDQIMSTSMQLSDNFFDQVESDNTKMLLTYDQLQENVILMKVDMFQRLNIGIDYVDADGD